MIDSNTKSISLNDLGIRNATIRYQLSSTDLHQEILTKKQGQESSLGAIAITGALDLDAVITVATSLSVSTTSNLGASVTTADTQTYTGAVTLSADVALTTTNDQFGRAVAAGGKYLAVSAPLEDTASFSGTGVVYVHNILNGSLLHIIQDPNPGASNSFGVGGSTTEIRALDISGNWLIAGSSLYDSDGDNNTGIAYIFNLMTGALHKTLANPNGYSTPAGDYFGANVAIDGHYAAVSAIGEDDALGLGSGKVYIFNAVTGALLHTLDNPHTGGATSSDEFGHGLSLSGKYLFQHSYQAPNSAVPGAICI